MRYANLSMRPISYHDKQSLGSLFHPVSHYSIWDRSGEVNRSTVQEQIRAELESSKRPYISLRGTLEERIQTATAALSSFRKW